MRLKHIKNADEIIYSSTYVIKEPKEIINSWNEVFNNSNPIEIEIGCGKGKYIIEKATLNPNTNYIGFEKYSSVLVSAIKRLDSVSLQNLKFICYDAYNIDEIFNKEIDKIYLTFSDPWPKKRHAKRRLTSNVFLEKYDKIFKNDCLIELKTDNDDFFEYSVISLEEYGYKTLEIDTNYNDLIKTEYEEKFTKLNKNINHIIVKK